MDIVERLRLSVTKGHEPTDEDAVAAATEIERLRAALTAISGFGDVNLAGEYEHGLRGIIRSMTDCAKRAIEQDAK
jgi:hypothetical protein